MTRGPGYVTCSDGSDSVNGSCPEGTSITGPVRFYRQSATVPGVAPERLGRGDFGVNELAFFVQDAWRPSDRLTLKLGLRWEGTWHPEVMVEPEATFYAPYLDDPRFPSNGTIPDDLDNLQPPVRPRLGRDGRRAHGAAAERRRVPRAHPHPCLRTERDHQRRLPAALLPEQLRPGRDRDQPAIGDLIDGSATPPFLPDIHVTAKDLELPRTWSFAAALDRELAPGVAGSLSYQHARTDHLFRFVNRNDASFGSPLRTGNAPLRGRDRHADGGRKHRPVALPRVHRRSAGGRDAWGGRVVFDATYTLSFDRSDDDNERDPFTFRYADASNLAPEYGWSDRDRRHKGPPATWPSRCPAAIGVGNVARYLSPSPVSESCADAERGSRAAQPSDRICDDGSILVRNTPPARQRLLHLGRQGVAPLRGRRRPHGGARPGGLQPDQSRTNPLDAAQGSLLFNFDGTIRSGLGDTRRAQLGAKVRY